MNKVTARILQIPKQEDKLDFVLIFCNKKTKNIIYNKVLVTTDNDYYSFHSVSLLNGHPYILLCMMGLTSISRSISLNFVKEKLFSISDEHYSVKYL